MKKVFCGVACLLASAVSYSQVLTPEQIKGNPEMRKKIYKDTFLDYDDNITSMDSVQFFQQRDYIQYPPIREADVLWSKAIWREIEVGEKINLPLYYPVIPIEDRKPLYEIILNAIKDSSVIAFEGVSDFDQGQFINPLPIPEAVKAFGYQRTEQIFDDENDPTLGRDTSYVDNFTAEDVVAYRLKEYWYFDKQRSQLMVKIIGINPICKRTVEVGGTSVESRQATVWVYFPELRPVIANEEVYNRKNETVRLTFDDVFIKRYFSSHIVKEDNVYNRSLNEVYKGYDQLVEAEKIKEKIFNFEHDLWDY